MKLVKLIAALFFTVIFITAASAQVCGGYDVELSIYAEEVGELKDFTLVVVPLGEDELRGRKFEPRFKDHPGMLIMYLPEAIVAWGKYEVVVSAPGYETSHKVISIPNCRRGIYYEIPMFKAGEKRTLVAGHVDGVALIHPRVVFTAEDGTKTNVATDLDENYDIMLKPGKYTVTVDHHDHKPFELNDFTVPKEGIATLRIKLKYVEPPPSKETFMLKGRIAGYNGKHVAADILIKDAKGVNVNRMISWSDGTYSVELFNGTYTIEAEHVDFGKSVPISVTGGGGIPQTLNITLPRKQTSK